MRPCSFLRINAIVTFKRYRTKVLCHFLRLLNWDWNLDPYRLVRCYVTNQKAAGEACRSVANAVNGRSGLSDQLHALRPVDNNELNVMEGESIRSPFLQSPMPRGYRRRGVARWTACGWNTGVAHFADQDRRLCDETTGERRHGRDRSGLDDWLLDKATVSLFETLTRARRLTKSARRRRLLRCFIAYNERVV